MSRRHVEEALGGAHEADGSVHVVKPSGLKPGETRPLYGRSPAVAALEAFKAALPEGSAERKEYPMFEGLFKYFPHALAEVAHVSYVGNQKHNPGQPLLWSRDKSSDHLDCIARHLLEAGGIDQTNGVRHSAQLAWRALANLQIEIEKSRGIK